MIDVVMSIKPQYVNHIKDKKKSYEFRNYIPKLGIDRLWVYTTSPVGMLEYVIDIDNIVKYPECIIGKGVGNDDFNNGLKKSKYAYHINHLYRLKRPIALKQLRDKYNFTAPQSYFYLENNKILSELLKNEELEKIY